MTDMQIPEQWIPLVDRLRGNVSRQNFIRNEVSCHLFTQWERRAQESWFDTDQINTPKVDPRITIGGDLEKPGREWIDRGLYDMGVRPYIKRAIEFFEGEDEALIAWDDRIQRGVEANKPIRDPSRIFPMWVEEDLGA